MMGSIELGLKIPFGKGRRLRVWWTGMEWRRADQSGWFSFFPWHPARWRKEIPKPKDMNSFPRDQ